jgi:hypothetical protein
VEPWWREANKNPESFCDPASMASLLEGALRGDLDAREAAAGALSRVVKALAEEPVAESLQLIAARLPELADGLVPQESFISGQVISVMRRVRPDARTVDRLVALLDQTPPAGRALVIVALGLCSSDAWTEHVECAIVAQLAHAPCAAHAVEALYGAAWQNRIALPDTLHALAKVAIGGTWPGRNQAALSLGLLLSGEHAPLAARLLEDVLASAPEAVRVKVVEVLGWRASELGPALLGRCLADESAVVRAAAQASVVRRSTPGSG